MKILSLYTNYCPSVGGIQNVIKNISEYCVRKKHTVSVICFSDTERPSNETINGVSVFRIKDPYKRRLFGYSIKFKKFYEANEILFTEADIIHIHGYATLLSWQTIRFLADNGFREKIIFNPHYEGIGFSLANNLLHKIYKKISRSSFSYPKKIICVSEFEKNKIIKDFGIDKEKIKVIANGISYEIPNKKTFKKISKDRIKLIYIGRIKKYKGIQYVFEAIKRLQIEDNYQVVYNIIGEGSYRDQLERLVQKLELDNINFLGKISDSELKRYLNNSDIFLLISESESYGIVVAEALANNIFVIVSNTTALTEFCSEQGCIGVEYPPKIDQIVNAIKQLVDQGGEIGPFNSTKIRDWDLAANEYESEYSNITQENKNLYGGHQ